MKERNTGLNVGYYVIAIPKPKRLDPYIAEAEDIIEALGMNFAEGCAFKSLWRRCASRLPNVPKKAAYDGPEYDGEKVFYYAGRIVEQDKQKANPPDYVVGDIPLEVNDVTGSINGQMQDYTRFNMNDMQAQTNANESLEALRQGTEAAKQRTHQGDTSTSAIAPLPTGTLTCNEYQRLSMRTAPPGEAMLQGLVHASMGLTTEVGEFVSEVKRMAIYGKPMTDEMKGHMIEELGDSLWYIALALAHLDTPMGTAALQNVEKLRARFPDKFSGEAAEARADKAGVDHRNS